MLVIYIGSDDGRCMRCVIAVGKHCVLNDACIVNSVSVNAGLRHAVVAMLFLEGAEPNTQVRIMF